MAMVAGHPMAQGLTGIMMGDSASNTTTGNYLHFNATQPPPVPMYSSPSTERAVEKEVERRMKQKFKDGYEKAMDEVAEKQKVEHGKKYKPVAWDGELLEGPPVGILESGLPEPGPFTQLSNHDFHKLLANFDALLRN